MSTKIPWTDETVNPWVGCSKCRAGCKNCYAERLACRLAAMGQENYAAVLQFDERYHLGSKHSRNLNWNGKIAYQMDQLEKLKHWHKGRRVFIGSMTDIFHEQVPFVKIAHVFEQMYYQRQHTYIIATKRPGRALEFAKWFAGDKFGLKWADHIHLLISCSTQKDLDEMAPVLFQIPAAVRGVSFEPLIEEIDVSPYISEPFCGECERPVSEIQVHRGEHWVSGPEPNLAEPCGPIVKSDFRWAIVGCEKLAGNRVGRLRTPELINNPLSGVKLSAEELWWQAARNIKEQCVAGGVAFYMKQGPVNGKVVTDPKDFPEDLRIREYPGGPA